MRRLVIQLLGLALLASACGFGEDALTLEQRAYILDQQILCPVCDGQTIDQSNAQIAVDLRTLVRTQLAAGATNREILDFVAARYGEDVIGSPSFSNLWGVLAWSAPVIILVVGLSALVLVIRSIKRKGSYAAAGGAGGADGAGQSNSAAKSASSAAGAPSAKAPSEKYLARVRSDIEKLQAGGSGGADGAEVEQPQAKSNAKTGEKTDK